MKIDNKHPYCVVIQPGLHSKRKKPFIFSLPSQEEEAEFLRVVDWYKRHAAEHTAQGDNPDESESLVC